MKKTGLYFLIILVLNACQHAPTDHVKFVDVDSVLQAFESNNGPLATINYERPLDVMWVQRDYYFLQCLLQTYQTSIYRYSSKTHMDSVFKTHMQTLATPTHYLDFIRVIAQTFNQIGCGHSGWSHTSAYKLYRDTSMSFFPLEIKSTLR